MPFLGSLKALGGAGAWFPKGWGRGSKHGQMLLDVDTCAYTLYATSIASAFAGLSSNQLCSCSSFSFRDWFCQCKAGSRALDSELASSQSHLACCCCCPLVSCFKPCLVLPPAPSSSADSQPAIALTRRQRALAWNPSVPFCPWLVLRWQAPDPLGDVAVHVQLGVCVSARAHRPGRAQHFLQLLHHRRCMRMLYAMLELQYRQTKPKRKTSNLVPCVFFLFRRTGEVLESR